jgi:hypothetical protein
VVFAPTGRIPSFEGEHRGLVSGSVAERPNSPSLLILLEAYLNRGHSTTVRKFLSAQNENVRKF